MKPTELTYGQLMNLNPVMGQINLSLISWSVRDAFQVQSLQIISTILMAKDEIDRNLGLKAGIYSSNVSATISSEKNNGRLNNGSKSIE